jgi:hypothetical protein
LKIACASLVFLLGTVGFAHSQDTPPTPATASASPAPQPAATAPSPAAPTAAPSATGSDASGKYTLREGTDVDLKFSQALSSKTATEGDPVTLELVDDLKVGDVVVARAGSKALGEVTKASKSGMLGKAGDLAIRLDYLKAGDVKIHLRGTKGKEGESGTTSMVVLTVLFGPIGLIKHGKDVEIKEGQALHAFVGDDIAILPIAPVAAPASPELR